MMKPASPVISIIIPAYNEAGRLGPTIDRLRGYLEGRGGKFEIIVVDDGSTDNTARLVTSLAVHTPGISLLSYSPNAGKGHAVKKGVLASRGDLVLLSDADLSTPIEELERLLPFIEQGYDIAIGSRGMEESSIMVRQSLLRETMGKTFNFLVRALVLGGITDTQCGFKLFRGEAARKLFALSSVQGFGFDVEILFLADKKNLRIAEVPVRWANSPHSRVSLLKDPALMLLDLCRIRINWLADRYGARTGR